MPNGNITANSLLHADWLDVIQRVDDEAIDLVYLDPPLSRPTSTAKGSGASEALQLMSRICQQVHRVLKPTGVLFFHTQPAKAFSIRLILNQLFGESNFRNEIVWQYQKYSPREHDVIIHYGKSEGATNNKVFRPLTASDIRNRFNKSDSRGPFSLNDLTSATLRPDLQFPWDGVTLPKGRSWRFNLETLTSMEKDGRIYRENKRLPRLKSYLSESAGIEIGTVWNDIPKITTATAENARYPGQKPLGVLERLIQMGSHEGDQILDPFCGSGTCAIAAERHRRKWIACDTSQEAIEITAKRLIQEFGSVFSTSFTLRDSDSLSGIPIRGMNFKRLAVNVRDIVSGFRLEFVLNRAVSIEETRHFEFKEVKTSTGAVDSIVNTSDEYAVAFLNSEGGRIYWGIRDQDRVVVGVHLNYQQRDKVRRDISAKLNQIEPRLDPSRYRVEIHEVRDEHGNDVPDICVVELIVPSVSSGQPYYTGGGEAWVKVDGSKQKLKGVALTQFIRERFSR